MIIEMKIKLTTIALYDRICLLIIILPPNDYVPDYELQKMFLMGISIYHHSTELLIQHMMVN
jgi:hypothetical protein